MEPAFVRTMWLPVWRRKIQPSRSRARRASRPLTTGSSGNGDVHLDRSDGERQSLLGPNLQAGNDRLANVREGLFLGVPLTHAPGDGWAFGNDHTALIALEGHRQLHE